MRSAIIFLSALAASATARTTAGGIKNVLADLSQLASDLKKLDAAVNAPGCGTCAYSESQVHEVLLEALYAEWDTGNATAAIANSPAFNQADSNQLNSVMVHTLYPSITVLLKDIKSHQQAFSTQSILSQASYVIAAQQTLAASLGAAMITKIAGPSGTRIAAAYSSSIQGAFQTAIAPYQG